MPGGPDDEGQLSGAAQVAMWSNDYVGTPWADLGRDRRGVDCWGLVRLAYADVLGIDLPSYVGAYASVTEQAEVSAHIGTVTRGDIWTAIEPASARAFDVLVFRCGSLDTHVGLVVQAGLMLHVMAREQAKHEQYSQGRWRHRLTGVFRHADLLSREIQT